MRRRAHILSICYLLHIAHVKYYLLGELPLYQLATSSGAAYLLHVTLNVHSVHPAVSKSSSGGLA